MFDWRAPTKSCAAGTQPSATTAKAKRQNCQRAGHFASAASMQTALNVVRGKKYHTCVGIFAVHRKTKKPISATTKAVPVKKAIAFALSTAAFGKTRKLLTQRAIATKASAIHSQRSQGAGGASAVERFVHINVGRKPICDSTDQSCASRMIVRYGSSDNAAGTPISSAASAFFKSWRCTLMAAAATQVASNRNEF